MRHHNQRPQKQKRSDRAASSLSDTHMALWEAPLVRFDLLWLYERDHAPPLLRRRRWVGSAALHLRCAAREGRNSGAVSSSGGLLTLAWLLDHCAAEGRHRKRGEIARAGLHGLLGRSHLRSLCISLLSVPRPFARALRGQRPCTLSGQCTRPIALGPASRLLVVPNESRIENVRAQ